MTYIKKMEYFPDSDGAVRTVPFWREPAKSNHCPLAVLAVRLLIMDEPTQGIDIGAKHEIYKVINELTDNKIHILLISSDFPELLAMSDRVAVVRDGSIVRLPKGHGCPNLDLITITSGVVSDEGTGS